MDNESKKELKRQYSQIKTDAGIYQIRNTVNNKILLVATPNIKSMNGKLMELQTGSIMNKKLLKEWQEFGEGSFVFEVLETLEERKDIDTVDALKNLEKKWLDKLAPCGERGYN